MRILAIKSQHHNTDQIIDLLSSAGHSVVPQPDAHQAVQICAQDEFDLILLPITQEVGLMREQIKAFKRSARNRAYIATLSHQDNTDVGFMAGANNNYPADNFDEKIARHLVQNVKNLQDLTNLIGDNTIDFPSAGGIIARSAFNQLYLSALDRSNRYAELSSILMISVDNYKDILDAGGSYVADHVTASLSQILVDIRRQTDIIGQIKTEAYALLLQMPKTEQEPIDAAKRFASTLEQHPNIERASPKSVKLRVKLTIIPTAEVKFDDIVTTYIHN